MLSMSPSFLIFFIMKLNTFVTIMKRSGANGHPCLIPLSILNDLVMFPLKQTLIFTFLNNLTILKNSWTIPNFCRVRNIKSQCTLSYALTKSSSNKIKDQLKCAFLMFKCAYLAFVTRTSENVKVCPFAYPPIFIFHLNFPLHWHVSCPPPPYPPQTFLGYHTIGTISFVTKPYCSTFILTIFSFLTLFLTILSFITTFVKKLCCNLLSLFKVLLFKCLHWSLRYNNFFFFIYSPCFCWPPLLMGSTLTLSMFFFSRPLWTHPYLIMNLPWWALNLDHFLSYFSLFPCHVLLNTLICLGNPLLFPSCLQVFM